ncbi:hypothetical protein KL86CLO1_11653 [uncultured Eubacteriales bacterium]|uniref:Uncharacterized protein n=1 Tax=uncultured Eubacteriales bacterium TaxID=172733 RepID=A0A212JSQ2_9FIRM|nr:hypothetical protein KL86CLO1_11653 [uncultured Eubacteriales bacterium]
MLRGELFSGEMVRAYQEGRKLHTARPIKPQPNAKTFVPSERVMPECVGAYFFDDGTVANPKHRPGDYIYCRETWRATGVSSSPYAYRASEEDLHLIGESGKALTLKYRWRPSIHMPREAARLFFRVSRIEAMRLEDVTEEFAREDGFQARPEFSALVQFKHFWRQTYGDARWMWVYWTEPCSREEAMGRDD